MTEEQLLLDRRVTDKDAEAIADHMVNKLVARLGDEATVAHLMGVWSSHLDQSIGKTVRRGAWLVLGAIGFVAMVKLEAVIYWIKS
jgi:hypothetical protein